MLLCTSSNFDVIPGVLAAAHLASASVPLSKLILFSFPPLGSSCLRVFTSYGWSPPSCPRCWQLGVRGAHPGWGQAEEQGGPRPIPLVLSQTSRVHGVHHCSCGCLWRPRRGCLLRLFWWPSDSKVSRQGCSRAERDSGDLPSSVFSEPWPLGHLAQLLSREELMRVSPQGPGASSQDAPRAFRACGLDGFSTSPSRRPLSWSSHGQQERPVQRAHSRSRCLPAPPPAPTPTPPALVFRMLSGWLPCPRCRGSCVLCGGLRRLCGLASQNSLFSFQRTALQ